MFVLHPQATLPSGGAIMPISPFLNGHRLGSEDRRVVGVAFELVCIALRVGDCDDGVKQAIAAKIIDLAKAGERNPDILCEQALKDIRSPPRTFRPQVKRKPRRSEAKGQGTNQRDPESPAPINHPEIVSAGSRAKRSPQDFHDI
jgi:hypothetical protein